METVDSEKGLANGVSNSVQSSTPGDTIAETIQSHHIQYTFNRWKFKFRPEDDDEPR
jgi:hypothetical protein